MSTDDVTLKEALTRFNKVIEPLAAISKIKPTSSDALESLESLLKRLPSGEILGRAIDESRMVLEAVIDRTRRERAQAFGKIEAEFIRAAQSNQQSYREQNDGWRIGPLEFQFRREQAQARVRYNHEVVVEWTSIGDVDDLHKLSKRALSLLESAAFSEEMLLTVFWNAYDLERQRRTGANNVRPDFVPILDFYREVRAAVVRYELAGQKPDKRLLHSEMPKWKFLYNLDRYRSLSAALPDGKRLGLQTGSQQEVARGLGLSFCGLDARQDYRTACYVVSHPAQN